MFAGNILDRPPVVRRGSVKTAAGKKRAFCLSDWTVQEPGNNVVWVNFVKEMAKPVNHSREAAIHLAGLAVQSLVDELNGYDELVDGWDGPSSRRPAEAAVRAVNSFLHAVSRWARAPEISLASDGEISVHWIEEDSYVDVSFQGSVRVSLYARIAGNVIKKKITDPFSVSLPIAVEAHLRPMLG